MCLPPFVTELTPRNIRTRPSSSTKWPFLVGSTWIFGRAAETDPANVKMMPNSPKMKVLRILDLAKFVCPLTKCNVSLIRMLR